MVINNAGKTSSNYEYGNDAHSKTHDQRNREPNRRIPGADTWPNLKIDRGAIQQHVDKHARHSKDKAPKIAREIAGRRVRVRTRNRVGTENPREKSAERTLVGGGNCSTLKHLVRGVLQVGGRSLALSNNRARVDFPSSHESSVSC